MVLRELMTYNEVIKIEKALKELTEEAEDIQANIKFTQELMEYEAHEGLNVVVSSESYPHQLVSFKKNSLEVNSRNVIANLDVDKKTYKMVSLHERNKYKEFLNGLGFEDHEDYIKREHARYDEAIFITMQNEALTIAERELLVSHLLNMKTHHLKSHSDF